MLLELHVLPQVVHHADSPAFLVDTIRCVLSDVLVLPQGSHVVLPAGITWVEGVNLIISIKNKG